MFINIKRGHVVVAALVILFIISLSSISAINIDNSTSSDAQVDSPDSQDINVNIESKDVTTSSVKKIENEEIDKTEQSIKSSSTINQKNNDVNISKATKSIKASSEETDLNNTTNESSNETVNEDINDTVNGTVNETINDTKIIPEIELSTQTIVPGNNTVFIAALPSDATGNAYFELNGLTISDLLDVSNGSVQFEYQVPEAYQKNYNLKFVYSGDLKYSQKNVTSTLDVKKVDPAFTITNDTMVSGSITTFVVALPEDATGKAVLKLNGKTITDTLNVTNGTVEFEYLVPESYYKNYTLTFKYSGNYKYNSITNNSTIAYGIAKEDPSIRLNNLPIVPGNVSTFTAIVPSDATGNVVFKLNGKTISDKIPITGRTVQYEYLVPSNVLYRTYNITVAYSGNFKYLNKAVNTTASIGIDTDIQPNMTTRNYSVNYFSKKAIVANLPSDATGTVTFILNKTTIGRANVVNGTATLNYNATKDPGRYRLILEYSGNVHYANDTFRSYLTINKLNSSIAVQNISSRAGARTTFIVNVTDELNRPVKATNVIFKLNGVTIGRNATKSNGLAYYTYVLPSTLNDKTYTINAISNSTIRARVGTGNGTLTMGQLTTKVSVPAVNTKINETITLSATLTDNYGNNVLKGLVVFKLNGKTLAKVNVSNGFALYSFVPSTNVARKFNVTALYAGTWKYAASNSTTSVIDVQKVGTITTTRYAETNTGNTVVLSAMIKDKNQQNVNGGTVEFKVAGKVVGYATVKNGAANYTYDVGLISKGVYRLNATYLGSGSYYTSYNLNYLNVTSLGARITGSPVTVQVGKSVNISVTVLDDTGHNVESGTVVYKINGTVIGNATVKNGVATLKYTPPYKYAGLTLRYIATLQENQYYNSTSTIQNITISTLKEVYVSASGSDSNLGDKSHPFKTLKYAVGHVSTYGTVNILSGTFPASGLLLNSSITIKGQGSSKTFITGDGNSPIFKLTSQTTFINLKSLTIKNGKSNEIRSAGAIVSIGKLNITSVNFVNNKATGNLSGGAIYSTGALNLTSVQFINNSVSNANAEGGAIRTINNTTIMVDVIFTNNQAVGSNSTGGGAIYLKDGDIILTRCQFHNNKATGKVVLGGTIKSSYGEIVATSCTFKNNYAKGSNYALGGVFASLGTGIYINNSLMESNYATGSSFAGAGGIYIQYAAMVIGNSTFRKNYVNAKTNAYGGAIEGYYSYSEITNTYFMNNNATVTSSQAVGGAVYQNMGNLTLTKCTFNANLIKSNTSIGGAVYSFANMTIVNSEFTSNKATGTNVGGGAIGNVGNMTITQSNFISNNASTIGDAISASSQAKSTINNNYWGSSSPKWSTLLKGLSSPSNYSKTKFSK